MRRAFVNLRSAFLLTKRALLSPGRTLSVCATLCSLGYQEELFLSPCQICMNTLLMLLRPLLTVTTACMRPQTFIFLQVASLLQAAAPKHLACLLSAQVHMAAVPAVASNC